MRNASFVSIAAGLALLAGCRDQDTGGRFAPAGSPTRTTGSSSDYPLQNPASPAAAANPSAANSSQDALNAPRGQQSVNGTLVQASSDEVRVDTANQPGMRLRVTGATRITLDGKDVSVTQLQEGSQVRASYSVVGDQPTALRIEVKSASK
jgi:hypothetical protein